MTALVQSKVLITSGGGGTVLVFDSPPTVDHLLIAVLTERSNIGSPRVGPTGWTKVDDAGHNTDDAQTLWYKNAGASESSTVSISGATNKRRLTIAEFDIAGTLVDQEALSDQAAATSYPHGSVTVGASGLLIGSTITHDNGLGVNTLTDGSSFTTIATGDCGAFSPYDLVSYRVVAAGSYSYTPTGNKTTDWGGILAAFTGGGAPTADFSADITLLDAGGSVAFTDLSSNAPTSWAWTFGDGDTSTSQNPTHVYATAGTYSVTLTATNASGSDAETKTAYIQVLVAGTPDPVVPAGVLLEIYAAEPGAARWDVAKWDEAVWSTAGWRDVTPYGINVNITWGSNRPELGILTVPSAASWAVDYHDPDRILDPSNEDGPYFGDLRPDLPIRISHRETIVRVGYVTGISHNFKYPIAGWGYMRGADNITRLANAMVPSDTDLADTLYARAVDAIAAAGLSVSVATPIGTDPPVSPWITGTREWSVWDWIKDAAQEVLHIPYVDRLGTLCFRPWASPLTRARSLDSTEMVDLAVVTDYSGLYSVVQAREDVDTVIERALTPPPRYGARTYTRDEITIDPDVWAETVLADRALHTLLWKPGSVRPLTALSAEQLATIEAVERVSVTLIEQAPPVIAAGIVVGGEIDVVGKYASEAIWRFRYELAQTATEPLIETGGEATDYLLRTGGGEYLYPTGGA